MTVTIQDLKATCPKHGVVSYMGWSVGEGPVIVTCPICYWDALNPYLSPACPYPRAEEYPSVNRACNRGD